MGGNWLQRCRATPPSPPNGGFGGQRASAVRHRVKTEGLRDSSFSASWRIRRTEKGMVQGAGYWVQGVMLIAVEIVTIRWKQIASSSRIAGLLAMTLLLMILAELYTLHSNVHRHCEESRVTRDDEAISPKHQENILA